MRDVRSIVVQPAPGLRYADRPIEICEHKGIGHPDTITDGCCEAAAVALAQAYRQAFGRVLHFNVDKGLLVGGRSAPRFGGGQVVEPAKLIICGRASNPEGRLDIAGTVVTAAADWLARNLHAGRARFQIVSEVKEGSADLKQLFAADGQRANDTSFGVGFAPLSDLERQVLHLASVLRSSSFRDAFPAAGDDFKIMGLRTGAEQSLTVALALIDRHVTDVRHYFALKDDMLRHLRGALLHEAHLSLNALDDPAARDESGLYLTVSGLSAEMGDDGQVGRGNRVNGLITPGRLMSLEAAAGKNPLSHVGKIYNVLANRIARAVCAQLPEVEEAAVQLLSTIGQPIGEPRIAVIELRARGELTASLREQAAAIARAELDAVGALTEQLARGEVGVY
jgi:S-adenosylmethionine synthetase